MPALASALDTEAESAPFHAWNPGIVSGLPRHVRPLATIFRAENIENAYAEIQELSDFSGLPATQLALFRPERLVVHAVLIRVMADLSVPLGAVYADLGVNFRRMVATILRDGIGDRMPQVAETLRAVRAEADALIEREIAVLLDPPEASPAPRRGLWPFGRSQAPVSIEDWQTRACRRLNETAGPLGSLDQEVREALRSVAAGLIGRQGFLIRDRALLRKLASILVSNAYGSRRIGELIDPWIAEIVAREGYRRVGAQSEPVVMNVKGASASGKSTIRPYQRDLAERNGTDWFDFAVITPDVWRKFLLNYDGLGPARRYAGPLTGHEVEVIDSKLDRYMTRKAAEGRISHLLIDRFRFDSFSADSRGDGTSQLLTRFGHRIYLQFMVTPPEATVERAWKRGEQFGRYKAVEDLLAHNVEAFAGMPRLFFLWALRTDKAVVFEFLDNTVPLGETPRTIAFGSSGAITILDARRLIDIDRFRRINIHARAPDEVYAGADLAAEHNAGFLRDCLSRLSSVRFAEQGTGRVFARFENRRLTGLDRAVFDRVCEDGEMRAAVTAAGLNPSQADAAAMTETLHCSEASTLGAWGNTQSDFNQ
ncbi:hypothetical protein [Methylobacterium gnaphalii]|nr:hypothetical protein [Methylobacterium gnaphalii]GJD68241.1 hypothetical protein MMMDOFMJ_1160 [Methylobacterium gnaphalii]